MSELLKWCFEHWPYLTAWGVFIIGIIVATYRITTKYHHWTSKIITSEGDCKKIDGHIVPRLTKIDTSLSSLGSSFDSLLVYLKSKDTLLDPRLIKAFSPLQLTPLGIKILEDIGGKDFVDSNKQILLEYLENKAPKTALDVQTLSSDIITISSNTPAFNHIKDYLFKNPNYKYKGENGEDLSFTINMASTISVMGIYLRNKYLEMHTEIPQ